MKTQDFFLDALIVMSILAPVSALGCGAPELAGVSMNINASTDSQTWHWGQEECPAGQTAPCYPQGSFGPFFYNYGTKWIYFKDVKFEDWDVTRSFGYAWCFEGATASVLLYH
jgi:hypothetical protein